MPIVYRCRYCGFILHVFKRVGQDSYGIPTPSELSARYGGFCPRCGNRLSKPTLKDIVVKPSRETGALEAGPAAWAVHIPAHGQRCPSTAASGTSA